MTTTAVPTDRIAHIRRRLNEGFNRREIGDELGISRERVRQLVAEYIDVETLKVPCAYCGELLDSSTASRSKYHPECVGPATRELMRASGRRHWERARAKIKPKPARIATKRAARIYKERGYVPIWTWEGGLYNCTIEGKKINIRLATQTHSSQRLFSFPMPIRVARRYRQEGKEYPFPERMEERCDVVHCIISENGDTHHYLIPAEEIGSLASIGIRPVGSSRWLKYEDNWGLIESG